MLQLETRKPAAPVGARKTPKLSGEVFGKLINLSGRRRFASQRLVLYAVLASLGHDDALQIAHDMRKLFVDAHTSLLANDGELPGVFCDSLAHAYYGPLQADRQITEFARLANDTLEAIRAGAHPAPGLLDALVKSATPLLAVLNQLTAIYEQEAGKHAKGLQKQRLGLLSDIERIGRQARMVCFNAQIVAARAGAAGREFAVVAAELSAITGELDGLVHEAMDQSAQ